MSLTSGVSRSPDAAYPNLHSHNIDGVLVCASWPQDCCVRLDC
jgi:hypothetical protein